MTCVPVTPAQSTTRDTSNTKKPISSYPLATVCLGPAWSQPSDSKHGQTPRTWFQGGGRLSVVRTSPVFSCRSSCLCLWPPTAAAPLPPSPHPHGPSSAHLAQRPRGTVNKAWPAAAPAHIHAEARIINNATIGQSIFTFFRRGVMDGNCTLGTTLP